jgi:hypothetical protein
MNTADAIRILNEHAGRSVSYVATRNEHTRDDAAALFYLARLDRRAWTLDEWNERLRQLDASHESVADFANRYRSLADEDRATENAN